MWRTLGAKEDPNPGWDQEGAWIPCVCFPLVGDRLLPAGCGRVTSHDQCSVRGKDASWELKCMLGALPTHYEEFSNERHEHPAPLSCATASQLTSRLRVAENVSCCLGVVCYTALSAIMMPTENLLGKEQQETLPRQGEVSAGNGQHNQQLRPQASELPTGGG